MKKGWEGRMQARRESHFVMTLRADSIRNVVGKKGGGMGESKENGGGRARKEG